MPISKELLNTIVPKGTNELLKNKILDDIKNVFDELHFNVAPRESALSPRSLSTIKLNNKNISDWLNNFASKSIITDNQKKIITKKSEQYKTLLNNLQKKLLNKKPVQESDKKHNGSKYTPPSNASAAAAAAAQTRADEAIVKAQEAQKRADEAQKKAREQQAALDARLKAAAEAKAAAATQAKAQAVAEVKATAEAQAAKLAAETQTAKALSDAQEKAADVALLKLDKTQKNQREINLKKWLGLRLQSLSLWYNIKKTWGSNKSSVSKFTAKLSVHATQNVPGAYYSFDPRIIVNSIITEWESWITKHIKTQTKQHASKEDEDKALQLLSINKNEHLFAQELSVILYEALKIASPDQDHSPYHLNGKPPESKESLPTNIKHRSFYDISNLVSTFINNDNKAIPATQQYYLNNKIEELRLAIQLDIYTAETAGIQLTHNLIQLFSEAGVLKLFPEMKNQPGIQMDVITDRRSGSSSIYSPKQRETKDMKSAPKQLTTAAATAAATTVPTVGLSAAPAATTATAASSGAGELQMFPYNISKPLNLATKAIQSTHPSNASTTTHPAASASTAPAPLLSPSNTYPFNGSIEPSASPSDDPYLLNTNEIPEALKPLKKVLNEIKSILEKKHLEFKDDKGNFKAAYQIKLDDITQELSREEKAIRDYKLDLAINSIDISQYPNINIKKLKETYLANFVAKKEVILATGKACVEYNTSRAETKRITNKINIEVKNILSTITEYKISDINTPLGKSKEDIKNTLIRKIDTALMTFNNIIDPQALRDTVKTAFKTAISDLEFAQANYSRWAFFSRGDTSDGLLPALQKAEKLIIYIAPLITQIQTTMGVSFKVCK